MSGLSVSQIVERRRKAIDAIKEEFWREHEKLRAESLRRIEAAEREYQQEMWRHLHRGIAA